MNGLMINLTLLVQKDLEMERQGFRRTRRFIGDANGIADDRWYRGRNAQLASANHLADVVFADGRPNATHAHKTRPSKKTYPEDGELCTCTLAPKAGAG